METARPGRTNALTTISPIIERSPHPRDASRLLGQNPPSLRVSSEQDETLDGDRTAIPGANKCSREGEERTVKERYISKGAR